MARQLLYFGYSNVQVLIFKPIKESLSTQRNSLLSEGITPMVLEDKFGLLDSEQDREALNAYLGGFEGIADCVFGFSFKGSMRQPYAYFMQTLENHQSKVLSVDVPSGWEVDTLDGQTQNSYQPFANVSLMLPKQCMEGYKGQHFLGANFFTKKMAAKFGVVGGNFGVKTFIRLLK